MRIINRIIIFTAVSFFLFSCIKNDDKIYTGKVVEWDAATWNTNNAYTLPPDSVAFPIMTRVPLYGRSTTSGATLSRTSGLVKLRVNLVGAPQKTATTYTFTPITNYALIGTPPANNTAAVAGTHYNTTGTVTIPADSSYGYADIQILDPGPGTGTREVVFRLNGTNDIKANKNYSLLGLRIAQP